MDRRSFVELGLKLSGASALGLPALAFQDEKSNLKITGVRIVRTRPRRPTPSYTPAPGSWSTNGVEVANPMSIYPAYKATRSLWNPDPAFAVVLSLASVSVIEYGHRRNWPASASPDVRQSTDHTLQMREQ